MMPLTNNSLFFSEFLFYVPSKDLCLLMCVYRLIKRFNCFHMQLISKTSKGVQSKNIQLLRCAGLFLRSRLTIKCGSRRQALTVLKTQRFLMSVEIANRSGQDLACFRRNNMSMTCTSRQQDVSYLKTCTSKLLQE